MRSEAAVWSRLRRHWPGYAERLEIRGRKGVPDVHLLWRPAEGMVVRAVWAELKLMDEHGRLPTMKTEQAIWLNGYARAGGRCAVIVGASDGVVRIVRGDYRRLLHRAVVPQEMITWAGRTLDEDFCRSLCDGD